MFSYFITPKKTNNKGADAINKEYNMIFEKQSRLEFKAYNIIPIDAIIVLKAANNKLKKTLKKINTTEKPAKNKALYSIHRYILTIIVVVNHLFQFCYVLLVLP